MPKNKVYSYILAATIAVCIMLCTTQPSYALRGVCIVPGHGEVKSLCCLCNCYKYKRDLKNRCMRCRHYARPVDLYFIPWYGMYFEKKYSREITTDKFEESLHK